VSAYESWRIRVQYTPGTWTDITAYVDTVREPIRATTGATPETTGETGSIALILNNTGHRFTPGNSLSALALTSGMPIQFTDTADGREFALFTGFIEFPEIEDWVNSSTKDQTIRVDAVDLLSRLERSATFVSTLGAHIIYHGSTALRAYYPLNELAAPLGDVVGGRPDIRPKIRIIDNNFPVVAGEALFEPGAGVGPPADDASALQTQSQVVDLGGGNFGIGATYAGVADWSAAIVPLAAGEVLTIACWVRLAEPDTAALANMTAVLAQVAESGGGTTIIAVGRAATNWVATITGSLAGSIGGPTATIEQYVPLAVRYGFTPSVFELWTGSVQTVGSLAGSAPASADVDRLNLPAFGFHGLISHFQVYVGAASDWGWANFQDQYHMGFAGLERQSTGERIRTIAGYAGLSSAELINVDDGCSVMQRARLAGQTVASAMYEARDTEQGDLFMDGSGLLTFHDRRTILNI
jgi:hypothetical protein